MSPRSDYGDIALSGRGSSVEKKRQRASRACDSCKAKKSRCSGTQPCGPCSLMELECQFTAPYTRGIPKTPPAGDFNWIRSPQSPKRRKSNAQSIDSTLSPAGPHSSDTSHSISPCVESISDVTPQLQETEEHTETPSEQETGEQVLMSDEQGHFVGTSSNVSFFVRLRKRLQKRANKVVPTSIFTFGDAALPDFDSLSFVFPPREIAIELVDKYFIIGSPTYRFLHRGTIEEWLNNAYSPNPNQSSVTRTRNAVLLVVFATATRHFTESYDQHKFQEGVRYFQAADKQLQDEKGPIRLESVQARLGQCLFLLTCSRINHCWSLFGVASRLIIALGLHRKGLRQSKAVDCQADRVEEESRKRLFWCAYNLDKYLSAMLGRPSVFHDEEIDQEFPSLIDDADLRSGLDAQTANADPKCQVMIAPVLHFKLVRIVSRVLHGLYGIKIPTETHRMSLGKEFNDELQEWRRQIPPFLDASQVEPKFLLPMFERQSNMLSLAYAHAVILVNRGWVLSELKDSQLAPGEDMRSDVRACLSAALSILDTINRMFQANRIFPAYWFTQYQGFCAIVIIYTYTIRAWSEVNEFCLKHFQAAERCQSQIASIAQEGSLAHRYFVIMEEFRSEVRDHLKVDPDQWTETFLTPRSPYNVPTFQALTDDELSMVMNGFLDPGISLVDFDLDSCIGSGDPQG